MHHALIPGQSLLQPMIGRARFAAVGATRWPSAVSADTRSREAGAAASVVFVLLGGH